MTDRTPNLTAIGRTGLDMTGGYLRDDILVELSGDRWRRVVRQMAEQDPTVGAVLFAVEMLVRQVQWTVQPANDDDLAHEIASFVETCLHDMDISFDENLAEVLSFLPWGWSLFEKTFKLRQGDGDDPTKRSAHDDGRIGWRRWGIRSQETLDRWEVDGHGNVSAMIQSAPPDWRAIPIPLSRCMLFRSTSRKDSPEGRSLLRSAYRPWYFKQNIEKIEAIGIERDLAGLPMAFVPPQIMDANASPAERATFEVVKQIVTSVRRDEQEGIVMPMAYDANDRLVYDFKLLSSGGGRQFDTDKVIKRYDAAIAGTMLADFVKIGHEGVGSYALVDEKTHLFRQAISGFLEMIAGVITQQGIRELVALNGWPTELAPTLSAGDVATPDLEQIALYVSTLSGAGAIDTTDPDLRAYLLGIAKLPTPVVTEEQEAEDDGGAVPDSDPANPNDEEGGTA